ncbi:MAG: hypothetical protein BHW01_02310 [Clostridium sp. 27_14]|nr:MAG: hypothetical protein BHW01_02310 [Clostridium sp. 27_14]
MSETLNKKIINQTKTEQIKIPENQLQKLNRFIEKNLQNRKNGTNYNLLYKISETTKRKIKINNRQTKKITTTSSKEQTKNITLEFFKELDQELYEKSKNIIEGKSNINLSMYKLEENEELSITKNNKMPIHTKTPCTYSKNGETAIYIQCKGTIEDIYALVHEISHTFDLVPNDNSTRNMLGEVTPYCFEAMLGKYLIKKGIATEEDTINIEKQTNISQYDDGVETFTKLELMKIKEHQEITQDNISEIQKGYELTNRQISYILRRLAKSEPNVDYKARYMIAQLIYPHYIEQYEQNPEKAIKTLKQYFEQIKANKLKDSLRILGINPNIDSIQTLIETTNKRIKKLENKRTFNKEEVEI